MKNGEFVMIKLFKIFISINFLNIFFDFLFDLFLLYYKMNI